MSPANLPSTIEDILRICPRFRILLVGKSGVGKSSLIKHAFNVDIGSISHQARGICDINEEIISPQNPRFVLHDSRGFEPGETSNLDTVRKFIQARGEQVELKDRIHAVWLCVAIPHAGGRVFETGDEEFIKLRLKVPVIVVFSKFDILATRQEDYLTEEEMDMSENEITSLCNSRADEAFQASCVRSLEKFSSNSIPYAKVSIRRHYQATLSNLINVTQDLVNKHVEGDVWIVSAMAQRASAQAKIDSSINVGMKRYWQGLASNAKFSGSALKDCLNTLHDEITSSWNFNDPNDLLNGEKFRDEIMALAQYVTPEVSELGSWFPQSISTIQSIVGISATIATIAPAVVSGIGLSYVFIRWISEVYAKTPETLRCIMGYIVDLTLVMDQLFLYTLAVQPPRVVSEAQIEISLETYKSSEAPAVHRQIREYVKKSTFTRILQMNSAQLEVIDLIRQHRNP